MALLSSFTDATRSWFEASFAAPTPAQALGWPAIARGEHTLIHAPTGSGKTLAAFLWTLDRLLHEPLPDDPLDRCRVLYVSPMKALAYDVERNLRAPLVGIRQTAERLGLDPLPEIRAALRTGDTPADERRRMARRPPDILITTPESLYLLLTSAARAILEPVRWVIVDEVHAVAGSKRGAHLALSLERLEELTGGTQRIGLSATQRPLDTIGRFLAGGTVVADEVVPRPVTIVDAAADRTLDVTVRVSVDDMTAPSTEEDADRRGSIWPSVYPEVIDLIRAHRSTIVFTNSRRLAERVSAELNELAGEEIARTHHGSVSREKRLETEELLKRGRLPAVVATSSLELGIDMGAVDLVVQIEAPTSVASGLQRAGRAGHHVGGTSRTVVFPKYRGDLLEATVVVDRMRSGLVEETRIPRNPLDVLAQQLVATVALEPRHVDDLYALVRRSAPYAELGRGPFEATLDMLAGRYPSDRFSELRPRLVWDRSSGMVSARPGAQRLAVTNPGTIPDRGLYRVVLIDGTRVGELDEEMVYESRVGDVFVLGSTTWRIVDIGHDTVEVVPAPGEPGARLPFWHGDTPGRPLETGRALGAFTRELASLDPDEARTVLVDRHRLDERAAANLVAYVAEELETTGAVPSDRTIVAERFRDEIGDWRIVILSPFGAKVHAPWAMALLHRLRGRYGLDIDALWTDDGIALRFLDADDIPRADELLVEPEELEDLLLAQLPDTALFAARFREAAGRALLLPKRRPDGRTPLWLQRRRAADLLAVAKGFGSFPIMLETYREVLQDDLDLDAAREVLGAVRDRRIRLHDVHVERPSPFASSLLFDFVAAFLYEGDTPLAERRAAALTLDRDLLRELLGDDALRDLIDPEVLEEIELELQHLTDERRARHVDAIHDLLRDLGPLTATELRARATTDDIDLWLQELRADGRITTVHMGGTERWAASEDLARLRDGLGVPPPPGTPTSLLEPVEDPLGDLVGRFARTHGPFTVADAAGGLGLPPAVVAETLSRLEQEGRVARGRFRPGSTAATEYVDLEVLRRVKRRTLARLRGAIEPVEPTRLGAFLPAWQGVGGRRTATPDSLAEALGPLQGVPLPASVLESEILAARLDHRPEVLDQLMLGGDLVWVGHGSLGTRDGRVALYFRDAFDRLWTPPDVEAPEGPLHDAIRTHLAARGASFFRDLYAAAGGGDPDEVLDALWDLVWAGEVTNDTLAPLRALLLGKARRRGGRPPHLRSTFPPRAAGRWSLVADHLSTPTTEAPSPEALSPEGRTVALVEQLLARHGVLTRAAVAAEGHAGGFTALYPVLRSLEEVGRVRRGYFVEGLGGAQFAHAGAVDRLRSAQAGTVVLSATDPANPYGAVLPWPEHATGRPARSAGSRVVLHDGHLVLYLERGGHRLLTFGDDREAIEAGLEALVPRLGRRAILRTVDGEPAGSSPIAPLLDAAGYVPTHRGLAPRR